MEVSMREGSAVFGKLFNMTLDGEKMPEEGLFKNKSDVQSCSNYRGIKLMSHAIKIWERVVEVMLRKEVMICEQQYDFMPRKRTAEAMFGLRMLMER